METWLTRTLGIDVPLVQAPMAGVSEGLMAGAVSKAGGLGMIGVMPGRSRADLEEQTAVASSAGRPYGIGLLAWALEKDPAPLEATLESDAALVSVSFGSFEEPLGRLKAAGKLVTTQVGTLDEARRAEAAGVDFIVARGREGGGHGRDEVGTLALLQIVLDRVDVPVVAAGGIATAAGLSAVLAAGAVGGGSGPPSCAAGRARSRRRPANGYWLRTTRRRRTAASSMSPNEPPGRRSTAAERCATGSSTSGSVVRTSWRQTPTRWTSTQPGVAAGTSTSRSSTPARGPHCCARRPPRPRWSPRSSPRGERHSLAYGDAGGEDAGAAVVGSGDGGAVVGSAGGAGSVGAGSVGVVSVGVVSVGAGSAGVVSVGAGSGGVLSVGVVPLGLVDDGAGDEPVGDGSLLAAGGVPVGDAVGGGAVPGVTGGAS